MDMAGFYIPKDGKLGEDAFFVNQKKQTLGIADGVGGWSRRGIDAGKYARELMSNSVISLCDESGGTVNPKRVLNKAYANTKAKGSSTACIITLKGRWLYAANVGDSGFMVFRDKQCVYKSPIQQHGFNHPYQLGNSKKSDTPVCADEIKVQVENGDVIVAGSDGLFDNMYPHEIVGILGLVEGYAFPEQLAWMIAESASSNSHDKDLYSPFAKANEEAGFHYLGGKIDDITVVVGQIGESMK
ncbi:SpoIIE domain-containing protein [Cephalotus follicularis]|uniref:Protein phosphatase n=1 Tax=Cephalotus follicularis TaxID=3775 RepID=A0A1Q3BH92_CEPFO|nr:SpoIIE domain-containing protein [Cephalotus follicularis]